MEQQPITAAVWADGVFLELTADARYVFLYCVTAPESGYSGLFELSIAVASVRLGMDASRIEAALSELNDRGRVLWDRERHVVFVVRKLRYCQTTGRSLASREAQRVHSVLVEAFWREYPDLRPATRQPMLLVDERVAELIELLDDLPMFKANKTLTEAWDSLCVRWARKYPKLDVVAQLREAHSWHEDNPKRRKKNLSQFLSNWLRGATRPREYDEGRPSTSTELDGFDALVARYGVKR